jgi:GNAT superfamily N-acetyltransferase
MSALLDAQAEYLLHLRTAPIAEVREGDDVYAVLTGACSNTENGVVGGTTEHVPELVAWFRERRAPASWLARDESLHAELVAAGCRAETSGWEMHARLDELTLDRELEVEAVRDEDGLTRWFDRAEGGNWFGDRREREPFQRLYGELALRENARVVLYLARDAFASAFYGETAVLLTQGNVDKQVQRRGIGTALAHVRLREAKARGCELAVLAPSPDGRALYAALGFELQRTPPNRWYYLPC